MVGLHIYHNTDGINNPQFHTTTLHLEPWHEIQKCYSNESVFVYCSFYDGYPIAQFHDDNFFIYYEGIIYNKTNEEVFDFCKSVVKYDSDVSAQNHLIGSFIESADGDFILMVYHKTTDEYLLFNDYLGRLPFYYHYDGKQFVAGRSLPFIVHNLPRIRIDKNSLTEFLMTEFLIGNNTLLKDVKRLIPAAIIRINPAASGLGMAMVSTSEEFFCADQVFRDKQQAIETLFKLFAKTTNDRVEYLKTKGYKLINTLSGGFDSRVVYGMINQITPDFTNITYEYSQDESDIARELLKKTASSSPYVKLSFDNKVHLQDSSLVFRTGSGVNIYTTSLCYNDNLFLRKHFLHNKSAVFGGLGGEFIRHPFHVMPLTPFAYLSDYCASIPIRKLVPVFNVSRRDFRKYMSDSLNSFKERARESMFKRLYNEYYLNYVVGFGEDRMRMFTWTVHPLMSVPLFRVIRKQIPLKWANFRFFAEFMYKVDSRLLEIPVFGKKVDLRNNKSIGKLTPINQKPIHSLIMYFIKKYGWRYYQIILHIKKYGWQHYREHKNDQAPGVDFSCFEQFYEKLTSFKAIFNYSYIKREYSGWPLNLQYRLLTVVMYLYELEERYCEKIEQEPDNFHAGNR